MITISYREEFIKDIKELFKTETAAYLRKEEAEELISDFFNDLIEDLYDENEAAAEQLELNYEKIKLNGIELGFEFIPRAIKVYLFNEKSGEKNLIDKLEDDGTVYKSNKFKKALSVKVLDEYLKIAFAETLQSSLSS